MQWRVWCSEWILYCATSTEYCVTQSLGKTAVYVIFRCWHSSQFYFRLMGIAIHSLIIICSRQIVSETALLLYDQTSPTTTGLRNMKTVPWAAFSNWQYWQDFDLTTITDDWGVIVHYQLPNNALQCNGMLINRQSVFPSELLKLPTRVLKLAIWVIISLRGNTEYKNIFTSRNDWKWWESVYKQISTTGFLLHPGDI